MRLNINICILTDTIFLVQVNISHDVNLLNIMQYENCTVFQNQYVKDYIVTKLQDNFIQIPLRNEHRNNTIENLCKYTCMDEN